MFNEPRKNRRAGFTLFELLVALAVVGLMAGIAVSQYDNWFDVNIKNAAVRLSSTIRYLHDKASSQGLYIRLVFDVEKGTYWVEATTEQYLLTTKDVEEVDEQLKKVEKEEAPPAEGAEGAEAEKSAGGATDENPQPFEEEKVTLVKRYRTPKFGATEEFLLKPSTLPEGVVVKDVYTSHDKGPVTSGQVFIYFFPNGYVEPAIINLSDAEDKVHFSIETNPIIGTTYLREEYKAMK